MDMRGKSPAYFAWQEKVKAATRKRTHKRCNTCKKTKSVIEFYQSNGLPHGRCKDCSADYTKRWKESHPRQMKKFKERDKEWRERNHDYLRNYDMARNYGLDVADYLHIVQAQGDACKVCNRPPSSKRLKRLVVDHCHKTGKIRGLLCDRCNRAFGLLGDDVEILLKAAEYLATANTGFVVKGRAR